MCIGGPNLVPLNRNSGVLPILLYVVRGMLQWQTGRRVLTRLYPQNAIVQSLASHFGRKQSFQALSTVAPGLESKRFNEFPTPEHAIYISTSTDPLFNLTLEDWYVSFKLLVLSGFSEVYFRFECGVHARFLNFCHQAFSQSLCFVTTFVDLPRLPVRCHRPKSEPVDGS